MSTCNNLEEAEIFEPKDPSIDPDQRAIDDLYDLANIEEMDLRVISTNAWRPKFSRAIRHYLINQTSIETMEWKRWQEMDFNLAQSAMLIRCWETLTPDPFPERASFRPAKGTLGLFVDETTSGYNPHQVCSDLLILGEKIKALAGDFWDWFAEDLPNFFACHPKCARVYYAAECSGCVRGVENTYVLTLVSRNRSIPVLQEGDDLIEFFHGFCDVITSLRRHLGEEKFPWRIVPLCAQLFEGYWFGDDVETMMVKVIVSGYEHRVSIRVGSVGFSKGQTCALGVLENNGCLNLME